MCGLPFAPICFLFVQSNIQDYISYEQVPEKQFSYVTGIAVEWVYQKNVTISRWERWRHPGFFLIKNFFFF